MWYINNKHAPYLRKARKNQNIQMGQKMWYHGGETSIQIPWIAFYKPNKILKWVLVSGNVYPYLEI